MIKLRTALAPLILMAAVPASAMHFFAEPPVLHLTGHVEKLDMEIWEEAMKKFDGKIDTIVFQHCPGGDSNTGRTIGKSIRERGMRTVVAGRITSACANMFLGGKQRLFSSRLHEQPTVVGYHGTYAKHTRELVKRTGEYFKTMSDGKMSDELIERFINLERNRGFLYFIHINHRNKPDDPLAYFCDGLEDGNARDTQCERLPIDALEQGVVTSWDVAVTPKAPRLKQGVKTSKNWD
jgi:hypothetical protein